MRAKPVRVTTQQPYLTSEKPKKRQSSISHSRTTASTKEGDENLVLKLYHLGPQPTSAKTDHGKFTITIKNGPRPAVGISLDKTSYELKENQSAGVPVKVWLDGPPPEGITAQIEFHRPDRGAIQPRGVDQRTSSVSRRFNKNNYNKPQTVILEPRPDADNDD